MLTVLSLEGNKDRKVEGKTNSKPIKSSKKLAATPKYISPQQLTIPGFESPFEQKLDPGNRWVALAKLIPWDKIVSKYDNLFPSKEGRPPISGRVILGSVMIKHLGNLTDRETIAQIQENMYLQYFLGYSSFTTEAPFSPSLFVEIRDRLSIDLLSEINEVLIIDTVKKGWEQGSTDFKESKTDEPTNIPPEPEIGNVSPDNHTSEDDKNRVATSQGSPDQAVFPICANHGKLLVDATVAPQNITFPTDLKLLDAARRKSEQIIDKIYAPDLHGKTKVRTYRRIARKDFLNGSKRKRKTSKEIYYFNSCQVRYLRRNLKHIDNLLEAYEKCPLKPKDLWCLRVLHTVYEQQDYMLRNRTNRVEYRIVNIHQPYVRPIVRGKINAKTEFGSKLQVSLVDGFTFIDYQDWEAFNEGTLLEDSVRQYKKRFGFYPGEVLADKIYCTRSNRKLMEEKGIHLAAKPLGRPKAGALKNHVRPGERNPVEGKFGQAKAKYGLDRIRAKLATTSTSWIASIAIVLNLVKLMGRALVSLIQTFIKNILMIIPYKMNPVEGKFSPDG